MQRGLGKAKRCYEHDGQAVLMGATVEPSFTLQWFIERKRWLAWLCSAPAGPCCAGRSGMAALILLAKESRTSRMGNYRAPLTFSMQSWAMAHQAMAHVLVTEDSCGW